MLNPCYVGVSPDFQTSTEGWLETILENGADKCRGFGRYVGQLLKDHPNIIWQTAGDLNIPVGSELEEDCLAVLLGVKDEIPDSLWTAHWKRYSTACDQETFAPYMSLDNAYGGNRAYYQTLRAYNRPNPKPTYLNEGYYEDSPLGKDPAVGTPQAMRAQAYYTLLSGATGHIYGCDHIWAYGGPRYKSEVTIGWKAGMEVQGSREMVHVRKLFESFAWHTLIPDQDHTVVTAGYGTFTVDDRTSGGDYVTVARSADGDLVVAYVPPTGTEARTITVDLSRLSGPARARWYNPTDGSYVSIEKSPLANSGSRDFVTPATTARARTTGYSCWMLARQYSSAA